MLHIYNKNLHVLSYMGVAELSELVKISHINYMYMMSVIISQT